MPTSTSSATDAATVSAVEVLQMATLDGARALGLERDTGSIESGKWADLACVDLRRCNSQPVYDPVSQLVYTANASQVTDVWVAGRQQLDNGQLSSINVDNILSRTSEWRDRISKETK